MKFLIDWIPLALFFAAFKFTQGRAEATAAWATAHLGFMVQGGVVSAEVAPMLIATLVVMLATALQIALMLAWRKKVGPMLWLTFGLVTVLGLATVWLHSPTFIQWKPTLLYVAFASALLLGRLIWRKNLLHHLLGSELKLPDAVWGQLNTAWVLFFLGMAGLNLVVAYQFSLSTWTNFKVFGATGLLLIFIVLQTFFIARHLPDEPEASDAAPKPNANKTTP